MATIFKMKTVPYYTLNCDIAKYLKNLSIPLSPEQRNALSEYLSERKLYEYEKAIKPSPVFRLTAPFFLIVLVLMFLFMPIKWMIIGKFFYEPDPENLIVKWGKKLGLNI